MNNGFKLSDSQQEYVNQKRNEAIRLLYVVYKYSYVDYLAFYIETYLYLQGT